MCRSPGWMLEKHIDYYSCFSPLKNICSSTTYLHNFYNKEIHCSIICQAKVWDTWFCFPCYFQNWLPHTSPTIIKTKSNYKLNIQIIAFQNVCLKKHIHFIGNKENLRKWENDSSIGTTTMLTHCTWTKDIAYTYNKQLLIRKVHILSFGSSELTKQTNMHACTQR